MRYLNNSELSQFHNAFLEMCEKHATGKDEEDWGYPTGVISCETFSFDTKYGTMYIGHDDFIEKQRWWIPIGLEEQAFITELAISFEMCIPKTDNRYLSVHYAMDDNKIVHILHKGKFTVGHGSVSMYEFFNYYRKNLGKWKLTKVNFQDYLELGKVNIAITDADFSGLLDSLADFAKYIPAFKDKYR
ncbi:hypothetical protein ACFLVU_05020 [Chloroflexota bacterium]